MPDIDIYIVRVGCSLILQAIAITGGLSLFYFSKKSIESKRYENMKVRQRMKESNRGEYNPSPRKFSESSN